MLKVEIKINTADVIRQLQAMKTQIPFAVASGLTKLAQAAQAEVTRQLPTIFDRPNPFTLGSVAITPATKTTLTSSVYIRPLQAKYLAVEITGGTVYPPGRAIPVPTDAPRTIYGGLPLAAVKLALARKDTFSGTVHGHAGIWRRLPDGRLLKLITWAPQTKFAPRFDFAGIVQRVVAQRAESIMRDAVQQAIATAR